MSNEPEPVEVEVVGPSTDVERHEPQPGYSALERAAEAAIVSPGVPGRDEFLALAMQARILALSGAAPAAVRNNPHVAFHIAMVGRDLGISPSAAIELIDVIQTKNGPRLSLSPQLLNGQIRRLGLGKIIPVEQTVERCVARAVGPNGETLGETSFDWREAQMAGLAGKQCQPGAHRTNDMKCGCNFGYISYPKRMLWWRAAGFCCDDFFPEAGLGLYTAEELGAVVDDEGRPVDPGSVALPAGYEPPAEQPVSAPEDGEKADDDELARIQLRIAALPDEQRADLRARWQQLGALAGPTKGTYARASALTTKQASIVSSILRGLESGAKAKGHSVADAQRAAVVRLFTGILVCAGLSPGTPHVDLAGAAAPDAPSDVPDAETAGDVPETPDPGTSPGPSDRKVLESSTSTDAEKVVDEVKSMPIGDVDEALVAAGREVKGNENARRKALVVERLKAMMPA